jgi:hypothetical protein
MWTLELQTETNGTQRLRVQISPETPPAEASSMLLNLAQLLLSDLEEEEPPQDGDLPSDRKFNDFWSGRMNHKPWDFPNSN